MTMTVHPKRKVPNEGAWYADVCVPGNTAYLILGERSLARLAENAGAKEMAARRKRRREKGAKGMRDHLWDEAAGTFLSVKRDTLEKIPVATIGSWIPLAAGVPTQAMARRMADAGRGARFESNAFSPDGQRLLGSRAWMEPARPNG